MTGRSWVIRAASHPSAGGGHISRCLPLARLLGAQFRLDPGGEHWISHLENLGLAAEIDDLASTDPVDGCVVDGYGFDAATIAKWRRLARTMVFIDDKGIAPAGADVVVSPWFPSLPETGAVQLCGLAHALVDPSFAKIPPAPASDRAGRVLVAFGRVDSVNATERVVRSLVRLGARQWTPEITVVMGAGAPHLARVQDAMTGLGSRGRLVLDLPGLQDALAECDLAIGGGGVSAVERAAAGRPSVTIIQVANQVPVAGVLAELGTTIDLGLVTDLSDGVLDDVLLAIAVDAPRRSAMAQAGRRAVDGGGAARVAKCLLEQAAS